MIPNRVDPTVLIIGMMHLATLCSIRALRNSEITLAFIGVCLGTVCFKLESISELSWVSDEVVIYGIGIPCLFNIAYIVILIFGNAIHRMKVLRTLARKVNEKKSK